MAISEANGFIWRHFCYKSLALLLASLTTAWLIYPYSFSSTPKQILASSPLFTDKMVLCPSEAKRVAIIGQSSFNEFTPRRLTRRPQVLELEELLQPSTSTKPTPAFSTSRSMRERTISVEDRRP